MHLPIVQHTLAIYETILNRIPPLVPQNIKQSLEVELDRLFRTEDISLEEVEQSMSEYGKKIWPYFTAFEEMIHLHENKMGHKFLMQKATPNVRKKYALICELGGDYQTVCHGISLDHFDHEEKQELASLLVELKQEVRRYAMQAVLTHDRKTYEEKIEYYGGIVEEINVIIKSLRVFAEKHIENHRNLARDVESKIKAIEHSLAFLGPRIEMEEIRSMPEYYQGRREERKVRWGI